MALAKIIRGYTPRICAASSSWQLSIVQKRKAHEEQVWRKRRERSYERHTAKLIGRIGDQSGPEDTEKSEGITFAKIKDKDTNFVQVMQKLKTKKGRDSEGRILLEGKRLLTDALLAGATADAIFFSDEEMVKDLPEMEYEPAFMKVPANRLDLWSSLQAPPGIMGVVRKPTWEHFPEEFHESDEVLPLTLVCENIQMPGNMGSILRCAAGVGCKRVLLLKGCCNPWESKVLRGGMGAHFRIPIVEGLTWHKVGEWIEFEKVFMASVADGESASLDYSLESYSVAPGDGLALILTGETEKASGRAEEFLAERRGEKIHIPMLRGMDSLNVVSAVSVILFEIRRQLIAAGFGSEMAE